MWARFSICRLEHGWRSRCSWGVRSIPGNILLCLNATWKSEKNWYYNRKRKRKTKQLNILYVRNVICMASLYHHRNTLSEICRHTQSKFGSPGTLRILAKASLFVIWRCLKPYIELWVEILPWVIKFLSWNLESTAA